MIPDEFEASLTFAEPGVLAMAQPQPQTVDGVASPAQASVSDLTGEQPAAQSVPEPPLPGFRPYMYP